MLSRQHDPIIAIATAPGRGAVGIVRVSGKDLAPLVRAWLGRDLRAREATYLPFPDADGTPIAGIFRSGPSNHIVEWMWSWPCSTSSTPCRLSSASN